MLPLQKSFLLPVTTIHHFGHRIECTQHTRRTRLKMNHHLVGTLRNSFLFPIWLLPWGTSESNFVLIPLSSMGCTEGSFAWQIMKASNCKIKIVIWLRNKFEYIRNKNGTEIWFLPCGKWAPEEVFPKITTFMRQWLSGSNCVPKFELEQKRFLFEEPWKLEQSQTRFFINFFTDWLAG